LKKLLFFLILFLLLATAGGYIKRIAFTTQSTKDKQEHGILTNDKAFQNKENVLPSDIPAYVHEVYQYIQKYNRAKKGYVGGRTFYNREKLLPSKDANNYTILYREWDVHPKKSGTNRGAERLVTGSNGSAYYTSDHYQTFTKLNQ
jgi:ribonuclease T1